MQSVRPVQADDLLIALGSHTVSLHDAQELDNDLRAGSDQDLTLAGFLGVVDGIERIVQDACFDHDQARRFSALWRR